MKYPWHYRLDFRQLSRNGFSLIEVVLALGVISFSSVVMMGLLGVGISSFQSSELISVSSKIREQVVGDLVQEGWPGVMSQYFGIATVTPTTTWVGQTASPQTFYFDEYGSLLSSSTGAQFQATVTPVTSTANTTDNSQGGGPASSASLIEFQIAISRANIPAGSVTTFTTFVGRN